MVRTNNVREFLDGKTDASAYIISAEEGSYWSMFRTEFSIITPKNSVVRVDEDRFLTMCINAKNKNLKEFLNYWIKIKSSQKLFDRFYEYWVEGRIGEEASVEEDRGKAINN